jgi:hypothetical protein
VVPFVSGEKGGQMSGAEENSTLLPGESLVMESDGGLLSLDELPRPAEREGRQHISISDCHVGRYCLVRRRDANEANSIGACRDLRNWRCAHAERRLRRDRAARFRGPLSRRVRATRSAMLTISSTGGQSIALPSKGMGHAAVVEFIDSVDQAKLALISPASSGCDRAVGVPAGARM